MAVGFTINNAYWETSSPPQTRLAHFRMNATSRPTDGVNLFSSVYIMAASYLMQLSPFPPNLLIRYIYYHIIPVSPPLRGLGVGVEAWGSERG